MLANYLMRETALPCRILIIPKVDLNRAYITFVF